MRKAKVYFNRIAAGIFSEQSNQNFSFEYLEDYKGPGISLTLPRSKKKYIFTQFPPFFDGLLPEGPQLEALLKQAKLDRNDLFGQLVTVGKDLVGAVSVEEIK